MKRSEAYVGQPVWIGHVNAGPEQMTRAVVVTLDCGDNGYRVGVARSQRDNGWRYEAWPLHSVHTVATAEAAWAAREAQRELDAQAHEDSKGVLEAMRCEAQVMREALEVEGIVVVADMRTGQHHVRLDAKAWRTIVGAVRPG